MNTALPKITLPSRPIPHTKKNVYWSVENASDFALNLVHSLKNSPQVLIIVTENMQQAEQLQEDCSFFGKLIDIFPDTETLPYDPFSPQVNIISERLSILAQLRQKNIQHIIITLPTLMQRIAPVTFLDAYSLLLKIGDRIDRNQWRLNLEQAGYSSTIQVMTPGEFAIRGAIIDLFPMGSSHPVRIDCLDDEVDSIRTFDPETQRTLQSIQHISLLPAREFETRPEGIERFRKKFVDTFDGDPTKSPIFQEVSKGRLPSGIENYFPLFFEETATFFDYLADATTLITYPSITNSAEAFQSLIDTRYERYRHDIERPLVNPSRLYLTIAALQNMIQHYPLITLEFTPVAPPIHNIHALKDFLQTTKSPVILSTKTTGRREALLDKLKQLELTPNIVDHFQDVITHPTPFTLISGTLNQGFHHIKPEFFLITEHALLGIKPRSSKKSTHSPANIETMLMNLDMLQEGDPIVHIAHGVGRYAGLDKIDDTELVVIEYQGNAKLYIPVTSLEQLSLYTGSSKEHAPWHKLGSDQWEKSYKKAAEKINDTAAELLDIYSRREAQNAKGMTFDAQEYQKFQEAFPFEETQDQAQTIHEVMADLKVGKMDRIICGDVGFGKTEVAMRAAFIAVESGYQVAVLAPTTLLAEQHAQNFADRFASWPIKISALSRFRNTSETREVVKSLADGTLDIVIGTHKLLSSEISFRNIGLIIIDEEHRFGVKQKEKLRTLRSEVNLLTMTATPIPRTLNMGLSGLRSLSIIATPPEDRLAVKTFVNEWNDELILEACMREFKRGGQVYFLHNEVQTIHQMATTLNELFPDITIGVAHGQMRERELENIMLDFYHHRIHLLLCTTIIESGIDVPNANTIIIHRADKLGLAQLHQLRGRVGRSHHRAYCYLITPPQKQMTQDAIKRITALSELDTLGAGFMLANHDLEIRGAGELLGEAQSGQITEIGFSLYMDLLTRAVELIKKGEKLDLNQPFNHGMEVSLGFPALIPENYLDDIPTRLSLYKRIASAQNSEALDALQIELIDRFGLLPEETKHLFRISEIKIKARPLNLQKIEASSDGVRISFGKKPHINLPNMIQLIQQKPNFYQLQGQEVLRYKIPLESPELRMNAILKLIETLTPNT